MGFPRVSALAALAAVLALAAPAASTAEHVDITASVGARVVKRASSRSWLVNVPWVITCIGASPGRATYYGSLNLVDAQTGERIYLGGVFTESGTARQLVSSGPRWRHLTATMKVSCGDGHGSPTIVVTGGGAQIPPLDGDAEGGAGGSGGGGSSGGGGGGSEGDNPAEPTRAGGCTAAVIGTDGPDRLAGSGAGDVVFGRGGGDTIRGGAGHDCLIGGGGNDVLLGEAGDDRLTGGSGADRLVGGGGVNVYDGGSGNDVVEAANGRSETVRCGAGSDTARVDRSDTLSGCERVTRR